MVARQASIKITDYAKKFFDGLYKFSDISCIPKENLKCILDIDRSMRGEKGNFIRYTEAF